MTRTREMAGRGGLGGLTRRPAAAGLVAAALMAVSVSACSLDGLLKSDELPADVSDPARIETPEGAVAAYHGLLGQFRDAFAGWGQSFAAISAVFGDELQPIRRDGTHATSRWAMAVDRRTVFEGEDNSYVSEVYARLQTVRGQAAQAVGLLARYAPPEQQALRGHAYALQAYAELFLAELFCSGIPLSTLDFDGDFTYQPGSTTEQVYQHALGLLDSTLVLAADSARFVHLARVGQARALLGLGRFAEAAAAAARVPDGYRYEVGYTNASEANAQNFAWLSSFAPRWEFTVADVEGGAGLDYRTSGDPRTRVTSLGTFAGVAIYHPAKYNGDGSSPVVLASAVEARLVEAEAALRTGGDWLGILNALRTTCTDAASCPTPAPAGSGGVAGLPPLADPGTEAARVDLLFRERAFWLFLTGQRQGDLRRLIRQYGRPQEQVYPTGIYPAGTGESYGSDVTLPIPPAERTLNPRFTGCSSRDA